MQKQCLEPQQPFSVHEALSLMMETKPPSVVIFQVTRLHQQANTSCSQRKPSFICSGPNGAGFLFLETEQFLTHRGSNRLGLPEMRIIPQCTFSPSLIIKISFRHMSAQVKNATVSYSLQGGMTSQYILESKFWKEKRCTVAASHHLGAHCLPLSPLSLPPTCPSCCLLCGYCLPGARG